MRTELALAVLGFVSVITLSSIFSEQQQQQKKVLLDTVTGSVSWGNFSYWKLSQHGRLQLELTSLRGDADLYISEHERPSYEVDRNNFSSATCGIDTIRVASSFPRPIGIGVFGHWSHETSDYLMNVYLETEDIEGEVTQTSEYHADSSEEQPTGKEPRERGPTSKRDRDSPLFLGLLSVLDILVEMFIV